MTKLNDQLLDFLIREGCGAISIVKHEEDEYWDTCLDGTCEWSEYVLDITFIDLDGQEHVYTYNGSLSSLIYELNKPEPIPQAAPIYYERIQ